LSRIDIAPPSKNKNLNIIETNKAHNLNDILDQKAEISVFRNSGTTTLLLPSKGTITERIIISQDNSWFEFIPNNILSLNGKEIEALLIKPKNESAKLNKENIIIHLRVRYRSGITNKTENFPFLDWAVLNITK
jgi:hypothetical protein